jgi:glycosyltransferase involved in cell wall biosynthesis
MRLSVVVIARNEEQVIARCLESVRFAEELIVLDGGSTDRTVEICEGLGARVERAPDWPGFGPQKNRVLALATGDWVLSIDADEWLSPELAAEVRARAGTGAAAAYALPRRSSFCGRFMRHGGWWPDYVVRLFRRGSARFSDDAVHERLIVDGRIERLNGVLMHESIRDLGDALGKIDRYSSAGAAMLHREGRRATLATAVLRGGWTFLRTYLLRGGFLDGREGFMVAVYNAENTYYKYVKLMLLRQGARGAQTTAPARRDHPSGRESS